MNLNGYVFDGTIDLGEDRGFVVCFAVKTLQMWLE